MINASELRRLNFLQSETGEYLQVDYIHEDVIGLINGIGGVQKHQKNPIFSYDIEKLQPIPLTEDILVKCGFKKRDEENLFYKEFNYNLSMGELRFSTSGIYVEYLHKLQNLIYSLVNEELEVNL